MKKTFYVLFLFYLISVFSPNGLIFAQEDKLLNDTLLLDIETTSYYDLVIWLDKLGLNSSGNIDDLREVLYKYYEINSDTKVNTLEDGRSIIIENARELKYFKDIVIDQNYIILQGEVALEMIDSDNNSSHKITADMIIFNQSEKTISAFGNIIYEISREDNNEFFYGDSLVFEIETWEGIFFEGVSETKRLVENQDLASAEEINFFFSGENIYRGSGDRIELNNGSITSSKKIDPYYRIDADKIWVLGPGEWAIKNATLFVGRIPVFYFPFFFIPGDEFIFNPALGYKEVEGYFINTTTYLIGVKEESPADTFSFLKSNDNASVLKEKYREGLFLKTSDKDLNKDLWPYNNGSNLKLLVDYYSRKGLFFGLDGSFNFDSSIKSFNIFTALSFSRYLYLDLNSNVYTPLRLDSSDQYVTDFEETYLFGLRIPFRFAFDIEMAFDSNWLKINIDLPLYSDTKFRTHFMNREEGLKWTELINNEDQTINNTETDMTSLSWNINGSINPSIQSLSPIIDNLSIDKLNIRLNWLSTPGEDPDTLNYNDILSFYYPSSLILPDISGRISGTLFQTADNKSTEFVENIAGIEDYKYLKDPWVGEENKITIVKTADLIESPDLLAYLPIEIEQSGELFTNRLKYSIVPAFSIDSIFNSEIPAADNPVNLTPDYSIFSTQTTSSLDYSFNIYDTILELSNISIFSMNYKKHFNPVDQADVWASYITQDNNGTNFKLTDNLTVITKPFKNNNILSESAFTYNLSTIVYNRYWNSEYDDFQNNFLLWNKDSISTHGAVIEMKFFDSLNYQILKLDTVLPPGNTELYPEIILNNGPFTAGLKTGFVSEGEWTFDPYELYLNYSFLDLDYLKQTISYDPLPDPGVIANNFYRAELFLTGLESKVSLNQKMEADLNSWQLTESSTDINLWFLNFNFLAEDTVAYHFIKTEDVTIEEPFAGWYQDSNSNFIPSKFSSKIDYKYEPDLFWKNRINLSLDVNSTWTIDLLKYTDTALRFGFGFNFSIAEFLDLSFETVSVNRSTYRYIPFFANSVDQEYINPFEDLIKSFNFFNTDDRVDSRFNLESIKIKAIHSLSDWDLNFEYTGEPILITEIDKIPEYQWISEFSIFVIWKPVPEIKNNINYSENELRFN